jgi:hypothetical protein
MSGQRLQGIRGFGIVVLKKEITYSVVQCIVQTSVESQCTSTETAHVDSPFALKCITLTQCSRLQKQLDGLVVATKAGEDQRCIVILILGIDVDAFLDLLLADFEIASSTCLTENSERLAEIERVILLEDTLLYQFLLIMEAFL